MSTRLRKDSARSSRLRFSEPSCNSKPGNPSVLFVRAVPKADPAWAPIALALMFGEVLFPSCCPLNRKPGVEDSEMILCDDTVPAGVNRVLVINCGAKCNGDPWNTNE